ncbi:MAG TPA: DUF4097 family beta strand repeat-containing protein [Vicinamibacterales bacterium]|nr:DUF4097 family beta strand repeat-containing protein [Vicinamibacterales bacterium]
MRTHLILGSLWLLTTVGAAAPAAQTYTFERTFSGATRLDVSTHRGKIVVTAGDEPRMVVAATVTVKRGLNTPANSGQLAAGLSDHPPVRQQGATVQLAPPDDPLVDRIVTIDYDVHVPASATVVATGDSGAVTISAIAGIVTVRTQSGPIDVTLPPALPVTLDATSGSGAIDIDRDLVKDAATKGRVHATIHGGGVAYQLTSKSGTIRVK